MQWYATKGTTKPRTQMNKEPITCYKFNETGSQADECSNASNSDNDYENIEQEKEENDDDYEEDKDNDK